MFPLVDWCYCNMWVFLVGLYSCKSLLILSKLHLLVLRKAFWQCFKQPLKSANWKPSHAVSKKVHCLQRVNQIFNPITFFSLPFDRCYMIIPCYLDSISYLHHLQAMKITFVKLFFICTFKNLNLAEKFTNLANNLLKGWTLRSLLSSFFPCLNHNQKILRLLQILNSQAVEGSLLFNESLVFKC